jgi:hypothetical protein
LFDAEVNVTKRGVVDTIARKCLGKRSYFEHLLCRRQ